MVLGTGRMGVHGPAGVILLRLTGVLAFGSSRIPVIRSSLGRRAKGLDPREDLSEAADGDQDLAHGVLLPILVDCDLSWGPREGEGVEVGGMGG